MTGSNALSRDEIIAALTELGADLDRQGLRGELFVVGGAAMALAYSTRRVTRDVDAIFEPKSEVYRAAERVAEQYGLPADWLNDGVKGLLPGTDPGAQLVLDAPGIRVSVPRPQYLLAMKVAAARVQRDEDDIRALIDLCGARTAEDVFDIVQQVFGSRAPLLVKSQYLIESILPAMPEQDGGLDDD